LIEGESKKNQKLGWRQRRPNRGRRKKLKVYAKRGGTLPRKEDCSPTLVPSPVGLSGLGLLNLSLGEVQFIDKEPAGSKRFHWRLKRPRTHHLGLRLSDKIFL
jgi:hypothetical protein